MKTHERAVIARELKRLRDEVIPWTYRYVNKRNISPEEILTMAARCVATGRPLRLEDLALELPGAQQLGYKKALVTKVRGAVQKLIDRTEAWYEAHPRHEPRVRITAGEKLVAVTLAERESTAA